ncbi:hypothetical protein HDU76_011483 [Blyttiomyces sp. JEL0837]|nr:hypothetical protein HDU76_011483 [Blyttiomyces sp. JEL0837]
MSSLMTTASRRLQLQSISQLTSSTCLHPTTNTIQSRMYNIMSVSSMPTKSIMIPGSVITTRFPSTLLNNNNNHSPSLTSKSPFSSTPISYNNSNKNYRRRGRNVQIPQYHQEQQQQQQQQYYEEPQQQQQQHQQQSDSSSSITPPLPLLYLISGDLILVNVAAVGMFWYDKKMATAGGWRVSEKQLQFSALLGGWIGGMWAMEKFRHKTTKRAFREPYFTAVAVNGLIMAGGVGAWMFVPSLRQSARRLLGSKKVMQV